MPDWKSPWVFDGPNPIANFMVGLEFAQPVPPSAVAEVAALHSQFKRELPRKIEQPTLTFQIGASPGFVSPQLGGVVFDSVNRDGTVEQALVLNLGQITYMTAAYTRWAEFQPTSERIVKQVADLIFKHVQPTAVLFAATNRFTWSGESKKARLCDLLRPNTEYVANHMLFIEELCHSFHGFLDKGNEPPAAIGVHNVNVQTLPRNDGKRVAEIALSHRIGLEATIDRSALFSSEAVFRQICCNIRTVNNKLFSELLHQELSPLIPGLVS